MKPLRCLILWTLLGVSPITFAQNELFPDIGATEEEDLEPEVVEEDEKTPAKEEKPAADEKPDKADSEGEAKPAEKPKLKPPPALPNDEIDPDKARRGVSTGVGYLRYQAEESETDFFVDPVRRREIVDWREVEVRYERVRVEQPIYKYKYETYEVLARDAGSSVTQEKLKKLTRRRVVGREKVGSKTVTRLRRAKDGPIVRTHRYPVYERGGSEQLYHGFYAQNAQCVYALLRSGEDPSDPVIKAAARQMMDYLTAFGLPDTTYDLAWLTAAFANLPQSDPQYKVTTTKLVNKLLLGQIQHRDASGMWGPICINHELLAEMIAFEQDLYRREIGAWENRLAELRQKKGKKGEDEEVEDLGPLGEKYKEKAEKGREVLKKYLRYYENVSVNGRQFERIHNPVKIVPSEDVQAMLGWAMETVFISGLRQNIYLEEVADLESTALVLFALYQAKVNGCWLKDPIVPPRPGSRRAFVRPDSTQEIIDAAVSRLEELQKRDGAYDTANIWLPVHAYDKMELPGLPVDDDLFAELPNETTLKSVADGYAALSYALAIRDSETAPSRRYAELAMRKALTEHCKQKAGRQRDLPFIRAAAIIGPLTRQPILPSKGQDVAIGKRLLNLQLTDGPWFSRRHFVYISSASNQRAKFLQDFRKKNKGDTTYQFFQWHYYRHSHRHHNYANQPRLDVTATCDGLIGLSHVLAPLVVAEWNLSGKTPKLAWVTGALERVPAENGRTPRYAVIDKDLDLDLAVRLPVITTNGENQFRISKTAANNLKTYLTRTDGRLVATGDRGWLLGLRKALSMLIKGLKDATVVIDKKKVPVMKDADGRVVVVFLLPDRGVTFRIRRELLTAMIATWTKPQMRVADMLLDVELVNQTEQSLREAAEKARAEAEKKKAEAEAKKAAAE